MSNYLYQAGALCAAGLLFMSPEAFAAGILNISVNQSHYLDAGDDISRIAVGNPEIADVKVLSGSDFLVVGKKPGDTSLLVWTKNGMRQEFTVNVSDEDRGTAESIRQAIGITGVQVQKIGKKILLNGVVKDQSEHELALRIAGLYAEKDNVVDSLQMARPVQIRLEAQILEINSEDVQKIGLKYSGATAMTKDTDTGFTTVTMGDAGSFYGGEDYGGNHDTKSWILNHISRIDATIQALVTNGKAKILSRPNIVTLSGEKASILIGGKIPVPTSNKDGQVTIEWHDYGIKLNIEPRADQDENITSKVRAEVSTLDYTHAIKTNDFNIPAIASREAEAVINVHSGMSMAIGGLLNTEDTQTVTKVPLLGDIPILGEFFKHRSNSVDNRELIILITPRIVSEENPVKMSDKMKENYEKGKAQEKKLQSVNVNEAPAVPETAQDSSILGKYLHREVLPKNQK